MIWIYRMQNAEGRGPWAPGFSHLWVVDREDHNRLPPITAEFSLDFYSLDRRWFYGTGCRTLEQLRRWFIPKEYRVLRNLGYNAVLMSVQTILAESDVQLVFRRGSPLNVGFQVVSLYDAGVAA